MNTYKIDLELRTKYPLPRIANVIILTELEKFIKELDIKSFAPVGSTEINELEIQLLTLKEM